MFNSYEILPTENIEREVTLETCLIPNKLSFRFSISKVTILTFI